MSIVKDKLLSAYVTVKQGDAARLRRNDRNQLPRCSRNADIAHIRVAINWLCRAQDVGTDNGVAAMYSLLDGWTTSYPETTGYIIPTLYDCATKFDDAMLRKRANQMAEWLVGVQEQSGAFRGLFVQSDAPPRVFNTGQTIFGLVRASHETGDDVFLNAAVAAGRWLVRQQDDDGAWRRFTYNDTPHTYNVRTAWALVLLGKTIDDASLIRSGRRAANWSALQQTSSGWFGANAFTANDKHATLHTVCYAMRGFLEIGQALGRSAYIERAALAAQSLLRIWRRNGCVDGAYDSQWNRTGAWRCLPGECQLAIVWERLAQIEEDESLATAAGDLLEQIKPYQMPVEKDVNVAGGLSGSWPIDAPYERYCLVNWGPKFLIDALLLKGRMHGHAPTD